MAPSSTSSASRRRRAQRSSGSSRYAAPRISNITDVETRDLVQEADGQDQPLPNEASYNGGQYTSTTLPAAEIAAVSYSDGVDSYPCEPNTRRAPRRRQRAQHSHSPDPFLSVNGDMTTQNNASSVTEVDQHEPAVNGAIWPGQDGLGTYAQNPSSPIGSTTYHETSGSNHDDAGTSASGSRTFSYGTNVEEPQSYTEYMTQADITNRNSNMHWSLNDVLTPSRSSSRDANYGSFTASH